MDRPAGADACGGELELWTHRIGRDQFDLAARSSECASSSPPTLNKAIAAKVSRR
jgi:hypothetical protein